MINLKIGQKLQLEIERMGINGEGIGVISGRLVFIPYALPGEEVLVEITENARNFSRAKLVKIIEKSPNRVKPQDRAYHEMSQSHIMHQMCIRDRDMIVMEGRSRLRDAS